MKTILLAAISLLALSLVSANAQGTAFTYQGRLMTNGLPANGRYGLRFAVFDAGSGGNQQGNTVLKQGETVSNGLFTVTLDFGAFPAAERWLEIAVRTSGAAFTVLSPRQKITPQPYAITAGYLSGTLPASQLSGTVSPAQLPNVVFATNQDGVSFNGTFSGNGSGLSLANSTINGNTSSNLFLTGESVAGWQSKIERLPWRGEVAGSELDATNLIAWFKTFPRKGFNIIMTFQQAYLTNRVNGHLAFNTNNFPMGLTNYRNLLHTNGWRFMLWYDSANATKEGYASISQYIDDLQTIARDFQPDIAWIDEDGYRALLAAQIMATNNPVIQTMYGVSATGQLDERTIALGNGWRLHGPTDVRSWDSFKDHADIVESNAWRYSGVGQFFYIGPEAGGNGMVSVGEIYSSVVLQAMWGNMFMMGFCNNSVSQAGPSCITNYNILDIQGDPAVICARRVATVGGCWVYLKPLGSPNGPNFAVMVVNTNAVTTNINVSFALMNEGRVQSAFDLKEPNYNVWSLGSGDMAGVPPGGVLVGKGMTSITISSIASHNYELFKLVPATPATPATSLPSNWSGTPPGSFYRDWTHRENTFPYSLNNDGAWTVVADAGLLWVTNYITLTNFPGAEGSCIFLARSNNVNVPSVYWTFTNLDNIRGIDAEVLWVTNGANATNLGYSMSLNISFSERAQLFQSNVFLLSGSNGAHFNYHADGVQLHFFTNSWTVAYTNEDYLGREWVDTWTGKPPGLATFKPQHGSIWHCGFEFMSPTTIRVYSGPNEWIRSLDFFTNFDNVHSFWLENAARHPTNLAISACIRSVTVFTHQKNTWPRWLYVTTNGMVLTHTVVTN